MAFQSTINANIAAGVPGQLAFDGALRCQPYTLNSASAAYNVMGATGYTVVSEGVAAAGGTGVFAGILVDPNDQVSLGTSAGGTLAPTSTLPNGFIGELATRGEFWFTTTTAAAIGDLVVYDTTTGALSTVAAGSGSAGTGKAFVPGGVVSHYTITAAGLGCISM